MDEAATLNVINLSFTHLGQFQPTIAGVNLTVHPGEIVLVAGATGSGKSTLLNCLAGIAPHHVGGKLTGEILYQNNSLLEQSVRQRSRHIGTLLQNVEAQIFTDRVTEELEFGLENLNLPPDRIAQLTNAALQEFGLTQQRNWTIAQLSAGQKQRLVLACILAMGQPLLLLDEPFAYLDRKSAQLLLQVLRSRANQGQTILLVEHRLDLVWEICDRSYRFEAGQLVATSLEDRPASTGGHTPPDTVAPSASAIVLRTQTLSWGGYPTFPDLEVRSGETILLKGDNGCGKTTLLKLLCGLLQPDTGTVEILGRNAQKRRVVELARTVGLVLQNPNHQLFAESVWQEVLQPGVSESRAAQLLHQLNLFDRKDQHPQSLSQGQKRRLALGAVLARQPQICLLDEITVGQDPRSLTLMLNTLRTFTQSDKALILTSHDPHAVIALSARVVEIEGEGMSG